jgi:high-affinity iron transporter
MVSVGNMLIGLREGVEACLVITIVTAFLSRVGRRSWVAAVRIGLGCALLVSVSAGSLLFYSTAILGERGQDIFEAVISGVALVFVTGMIFWMRHPMQEEQDELKEKLTRAMRLGPVAAVAIACLAVMREGIEATTFVFVSAEQTGQGLAGSLASLLIGVAAAIALTWLLYLGAVRINLSTFFTVTGFLLIFVAAGVVCDAVGALQAADILPGAHAIAFDLSGVISTGTWYGSLLGGLLNIPVRPTVLEAIAWAGYWVGVCTVFLVVSRKSVRPAAPSPAELAADRG